MGHNGRQRVYNLTPDSSLLTNARYPDQKENVEINVKGNLTQKEEKDLLDKLEKDKYYLAVYKRTGKDRDTKEKIKVNIVKDGEKLFLRLPIYGTNNNLTVEEGLKKIYNLDEKIIPNGIYDLIGEKNLLKNENLEVSFESDKFGVLNKDLGCSNGNYKDVQYGGCK